MQVHGAHDQVEALRREGQELLVGHHRRAARAAGKALAEIGAHQAAHGLALAQRRGDFVAMRAEVEGQRKSTAHVVQAFDEAVGDLALEEGLAVPIARRTLAPPAQHGAVENQQGIGARHRPYVGPKRGWPVGEPPSCRRILTVPLNHVARVEPSSD